MFNYIAIAKLAGFPKRGPHVLGFMRSKYGFGDCEARDVRVSDEFLAYEIAAAFRCHVKLYAARKELQRGNEALSF